jgi:hypothetical protein
MKAKVIERDPQSSKLTMILHSKDALQRAYQAPRTHSPL